MPAVCWPQSDPCSFSFSQPHFWTFLLANSYFFWDLQGQVTAKLPIFASACPGEVSWQVGFSLAWPESGVRDPARCSNSSLGLKPSRNAAGGSRCLGCTAESCSHQRDAPGKPQTPSHPGGAWLLPPPHHGCFCRDLSLALRMLMRIGESSRKLFSAHGRSCCRALAPGDQPRAPPWPN